MGDERPGWSVSHSDTLRDLGKVDGPDQSSKPESPYSRTGLCRGLIFEDFGQSELIEVQEMDNPTHFQGTPPNLDGSSKKRLTWTNTLARSNPQSSPVLEGFYLLY